MPPPSTVQCAPGTLASTQGRLQPAHAQLRGGPARGLWGGQSRTETRSSSGRISYPARERRCSPEPAETSSGTQDNKSPRTAPLRSRARWWESRWVPGSAGDELLLIPLIASSLPLFGAGQSALFPSHKKRRQLFREELSFLRIGRSWRLRESTEIAVEPRRAIQTPTCRAYSVPREGCREFHSLWRPKQKNRSQPCASHSQVRRR